MTVVEMARLGGYACAKARTKEERTRIARKASCGRKMGALSRTPRKEVNEEFAEHNSRVLKLSQTVLKAAQSMESEDWQSVEMHAKEAARQARVLKMIESKQKKVDEENPKA